MSDFNVSISSSGLRAGESDKVSSPPVKNSAAPVNNLTSLANNGEVVAQESKELPAEDVESTVEEVNAFVQSMQRNLSFTVDEELGEPIISVKDMETNEVIRQIPSEELVVLRKKMDDVTGILFDTKV